MIDRFSISQLGSESNRKLVMGLAIILSVISLSLLAVAVSASSANFATMKRASWAVGKGK